MDSFISKDEMSEWVSVPSEEIVVVMDSDTLSPLSAGGRHVQLESTGTS